MTTPPIGQSYFRRNPCQHRGDVLRIAKGTNCICAGSQVEIRECSVFGECAAIEFRRRDNPKGICKTCDRCQET